MYLILKLLHLTGVVMFLGNIIVGVFWKAFADRSGNMAIMASTIDGIIAADRVFTIPGVVLLIVAGIAATFVGGIPILSTGWVLWGLGLIVLGGLAFGPLARAQRRLSVAAHAGDLQAYEDVSKSWNLFGTMALLLPLAAFVIMILKPALPAFGR